MKKKQIHILGAGYVGLLTTRNLQKNRAKRYIGKQFDFMLYNGYTR